MGINSIRQWIASLNPKRPVAGTTAYDIAERQRRITNAKKGITHMGGL